MATLGELERTVMDVLWSAPDPLSASDLRDKLLAKASETAGRRQLAATTILTVLSRLEAKGFVSRDRSQRPHLYVAVTTRADHTAELMHEVLGSSPDREAALARFIGQVSPAEADTLRSLLGVRPPALK
ncbi:Predicted transcriptional regulator [Paramicrobacterium humi]|uniref:Predicted transcriptional regulator n=1 Tax=Paramicrobacterium humi TaxID=640635 RepID=A0A1H4QBS5_9MICO|nr:BlaI/MecI/CopY family transcriptional regulator [Microbacterium humi]SEC16932.1 Predicted transcriptional regulator [Microbacterium humi]